MLALLPGLKEMSEAVNALAGVLNCQRRDTVLALRVLQSSLATEERMKLVSPLSPRECRVVLTTSMGESYVTVPSVLLALSSGLHRAVAESTLAGSEELATAWISEKRGDSAEDARPENVPDCTLVFTTMRFKGVWCHHTNLCSQRRLWQMQSSLVPPFYGMLTILSAFWRIRLIHAYRVD